MEYRDLVVLIYACTILFVLYAGWVEARARIGASWTLVHKEHITIVTLLLIGEIIYLLDELSVFITVAELPSATVYIMAIMCGANVLLGKHIMKGAGNA